ncbi:MAG: hypothetical protein MUE56_08750 [Ignavibacteria bacterium]|jgi:hypothetical protein|nr:hypothetical protein [Ignavibacteria bacterium]
MEKHTDQQLQDYYRTNRKYFDELAGYYYKTDPDFYAKSVAPIYSQKHPGEVTCPYCLKPMIPADYHSLSLSRIMLFASGIFLFFASLFIGYFFSILLGTFFGFIAIAMFVMGFFFKKVKKRCSLCRMPIPYLLMK